MTDSKDFYRCARLLIDQHADDAEQWALNKMQQFMDEEDVAAAATWLMIAQAIRELKKDMPSCTIH